MLQPPPPMDPNDLGRGPMIMGLTWAFASLAILVVALRFYVRIKLSNGPALEDWIMGGACVVNVITQSFVTVGYHYGLGKHDANLMPNQMINVLKWMWLANTPGLIVSVLARVSIAILLVRIMGVHVWLKWFLIVVTGVCTVLTTVILPCTYLQSTPVSGNWNPMLIRKHWDPMIWITMAYLAQSLWTFTDLTFVLFPVLIIWRLQMALRQRIGLILLMCTSLVTMTFSILKTISLKHIQDQQADPTATDVQYDATLTILWTCLELAFVIIMGCIPPLRSMSRLELVKSLSSSISSVLRTKKSSRTSEGAYPYENNSGPYEGLEMSNDEIDKSSGSRDSTPNPYGGVAKESRKNLVMINRVPAEV